MSPMSPRSLAVLAIAALLALTPACRPGSAPAVTESTTATPRPHAPGALALPPPALGASSPLVVVTLFTDFECPYCREMAPAMTRLAETWPADLQVQLRHLPLSFHGLAEAAARAAVAAQLQGRFAAMHDLLFRRQAEWSALADVPAFTAWAQAQAASLGLDAPRFAADLAAPETAARVAEDAAKGRALSLPGTPSVLVGARLADPTAGVAGILSLARDELSQADNALRSGVPRAEVPYQRALAGAPDSHVADWLIRDLTAAEAPPHGAPQLSDSGDRGRAVSEQRWEVPVRPDDPARGPSGAPVTLVLFEDVQCPFCEALRPTLARLLERYPRALRLVVKSLPLPFHAQARPAALALECARQTGQFWPLRERLLADRERLSDAAIRDHAAAVGLSADALAACLAAPETAARVDEDLALAERVGARGTPVLYMNGRKIAGSRPLADLAALVDLELAHARAVAKDTLNPYPAIIAGAAALAPLAAEPVALDLTDAPRRGPADAALQLVLFNDLACEPCRQVATAVARQATSAPAPGEPKVAVYVRPFVRPGDPSSELAARVQLCAGRQALFWPLHEALSRHGIAVRDDVAPLAREAGADGDALLACLDEPATDAAIARAQADAAALSISAAPTLFFDGRRYDGSLGYGPRALHRLIAARQ